MMRAVLDTNVIVSGYLWKGIPSLIVDHVEQGSFLLCLSRELLREYERVLDYPHLAPSLASSGYAKGDIISTIKRIATFVPLASIPPVVADDPTDDIVIATAVVTGAHVVVSGDRHLLNLKHYQGIPILTPRRFLALL